MYKTKIITWIVVISLLLGCKYLIPAIKTVSLKEDITVQISGDEINDLSQILSSTKLNGYKMKVVNSNARIILSDKEQEIEGYSRHNNFLYSPLCLFVDNMVNSDNEGFISVEADDYYPYKVDLKSILLAMEKDETWDKLGCKDTVLNGKVTLHIASIGSFYKETENLFYLTLNDGAPVDEAKREELKPRVDAILNKCVKVTDISQAMDDKYKDAGKDRIAFIAPEYLYYALGGCTYSGNNHSFVPVYFKKTVYLNTYIYVADNMKDNESVNIFLRRIKEKDDIFYSLGWRANESDIDVSDVSGVFLVSP